MDASSLEDNRTSKELISVIVPVYNAEKYVEICINSILSQDYSELEIILVDDGSTDNSYSICKEIATKYENILLIHTENRGAACARNLGIEKSKGDYLLFVDADDTIEQEYISFLYSNINDAGADLSICGYRKVYPDQERGHSDSEYKRIVMTGYEAMEKLLYQQDFMSVPWGCLSKKLLWDNVKFPEGKRVEDVGTIYKLYASATKVVYCPRPLYNYYQRISNTIYSTSSALKNNDYYEHSKAMVKYVESMCPQYINSAYSRHFSTCFQILSETSISEESKSFLSDIKTDIIKIRKMVLCDKKTRKVNRCAALLSYISIGLLHRVLLGYYSAKMARIRRRGEKIEHC